ncbi:MAG: hypothetical protein AAFO62_13530 [Pseudomonadota bacterium]
MFVSNAVFNALGKPHVSALINWSRATVSTIPIVIVLSGLFGAAGVLTGFLAGAIPVGIFAVWFALRAVDAIDLSGRTNV